jgi:hypothetical protein
MTMKTRFVERRRATQYAHSRPRNWLRPRPFSPLAMLGCGVGD